MRNEQLPEIIEFKGLVKSIFGSQKAAAKALRVNEKTFSRLPVQQIPVYESLIESYINKIYPIPSFTIKEYKDARNFVTYYGKDIKRWFKQGKEQYKDRQTEFTETEFTERLYDSNDNSFIEDCKIENISIIFRIREEHHGYSTISQNWIKHLTIYTLFESKKDFEKHEMDKYGRICDITNWQNLPNDTYDAQNLPFWFWNILNNVMIDSLFFAVIRNHRIHSSESTCTYFLIKKNKVNRVENGELIGLFIVTSNKDEQIAGGFTFFVSKNVDTDSWKTIDVCVTGLYYPMFGFFEEYNSQNQLQCNLYLSDGQMFKIYNSNTNSLVSIFSDGFYIIPEEECTNFEYIIEMIIKDLNEDLYAKEKYEKILDLFLSNPSYNLCVKKLLKELSKSYQ